MTTPTITIIGNLTADPDLRTTGTGRTVCNLTIASNNSRRNQDTGEWEQTGSLFVHCNAWDEDHTPLATNMAASLRKGMKVIATGRIQEHSYTGRDGQQHTSLEMRVSEIGPALTRQQTSPVTGHFNDQPPTDTPPTPSAVDDPWGVDDGGVDAF